MFHVDVAWLCAVTWGGIVPIPTAARRHTMLPKPWLVGTPHSSESDDLLKASNMRYDSSISTSINYIYESIYSMYIFHIYIYIHHQSFPTRRANNILKKKKRINESRSFPLPRRYRPRQPLTHTEVTLAFCLCPGTVLQRRSAQWSSDVLRARTYGFCMNLP